MNQYLIVLLTIVLVFTVYQIYETERNISEIKKRHEDYQKFLLLLEKRRRQQ